MMNSTYKVTAAAQSQDACVFLITLQRIIPADILHIRQINSTELRKWQNIYHRRHHVKLNYTKNPQKQKKTLPPTEDAVTLRRASPGLFPSQYPPRDDSISGGNEL